MVAQDITSTIVVTSSVMTGEHCRPRIWEGERSEVSSCAKISVEKEDRKRFWCSLRYFCLESSSFRTLKF